jgi:NitT/TauT family transport system substrate-binding protein
VRSVSGSLLKIGCAVMLLAGVAACGSGNSGRAAALSPEKPDLTVAAVPVADEAGLYIAQDLGYFRAAGLHVTIKSVLSSADVAAGMRSGSYDITAGNSVSYIQDQVTGLDNLDIIAEGSLMQPGNQVLYTLPGSRITSVADMAGKRIGVNAKDNIGTLLITELLQAQGISPNQVRFVVVSGGFANMEAALGDKSIDVAWLPEPFGSIFGAANGLREIADLDQGAASSFPVGWYVATKTWVKKYPHTLAAFLGALQKGQNVADTDRVEVENAMELLPKPYTVPQNIAAIMSLETYPLTVFPDIDVTRVQRVADAMYQTRMLTTPFNMTAMTGP